MLATGMRAETRLGPREVRFEGRAFHSFELAAAARVFRTECGFLEQGSSFRGNAPCRLFPRLVDVVPPEKAKVDRLCGVEYGKRRPLIGNSGGFSGGSEGGAGLGVRQCP